MPRSTDYHPGMSPDELAPIRLTEEQKQRAAENFALVFHAARHYSARTGLDHDDLVDRFSESLVCAARSWTPESGCRFSTAAWKWFKKAIGERSTMRIIAVPSRARDHAHRTVALESLAMRRVIDRQQTLMGRFPAREPDRHVDFDDLPALRGALDRMSPLRFAFAVECLMGEVQYREFRALHGLTRIGLERVRDDVIRILRGRGKG